MNSMMTAPRDGREILLCVKMRAGIPGKFLVGHWMPGGHCIEDHPPIDAGWYFWNGCLFDKASEPEGWMPLPDPDEKPRLPVGVSVLITDHLGRLLLGKRINNSGAGLLSTPGGRLEEHENMYACAEREVLEEVDVHVKRYEMHVLGFEEHFRFGNHYFMIYIHASRYYGVIKNTEPEKCESWDWHELETLAPTICMEPMRIIELLRKRLEAM